MSGNTNDDLVDQHENLDQNRYEDPARPLPPPLPPIIMIGFGLDPAPQQLSSAPQQLSLCQVRKGMAH